MNELDWAIVIVLALSTIVGVARGVIREILSIVGWVIGIVFALKYSTELADKIPLESLGTELALTGLTVGETGIEIQTESLIGLAGEELKDRLSCLVGDGLDPYLERFAEDLKDFFAKYAGN